MPPCEFSNFHQWCLAEDLLMISLRTSNEEIISPNIIPIKTINLRFGVNLILGVVAG